MFKTFTPIRALNKAQFSIPVTAIRAVLYDKVAQEALLQVEPKHVFDLKDESWYTRISVEGSVKELTDYING